MPYKGLTGNETTERVEIKSPLDGPSSREEMTELRRKGVENR